MIADDNFPCERIDVIRKGALSRFLSRDGARGVAAIEFGLVASSLMAMAVCVSDVGIGLYRQQQVQTAAQAGAQYAMVQVQKGASPPLSASSISNAVTSATSFAAISASPAPTQYCGCPSGTQPSSPASLPCTFKCDDGSTAGTYVSVSAQATYTTIVQYPLLPASFSLSATASARIQ